MEPGNGGTSSIEVVKEFLEQLQGREPRVDEISRIRPALDDLVAKIARLHRMSPAYQGVRLSEDVLRLVRLAHASDSGPDWLRIAALF